MKVKYMIDEGYRFEQICKNEGLNPDNFRKYVDNPDNFNVSYTLEGIPNSGTLNYTLIDRKTGKKLNINTIKPYQMGLLGVCFNHFNGAMSDEALDAECITREVEAE